MSLRAYRSYKSPEELSTKYSYNHYWYLAHRDRICAIRRQRYDACPDTKSRRIKKAVEQHKRRVKLKEAYRTLIDSTKDVPCLDCSQRFPPECMDFDHVRGEKFAGVGRMGHVNLERIRLEIAKCEVVCANCHRTRTKKRRLLSSENKGVV